MEWNGGFSICVGILEWERNGFSFLNTSRRNDMNVFYKNFILSIVLYFVLVIFDYVENHTFNWTENMIQSLFFVVFFRLFMWFLDGKKAKNLIS